MAAHDSMPFGTHVLFTYGPLGFLASPVLYYRATALASLLYEFGVAAALFATLTWALAKVLWAGAAVILAYLMGQFILAAMGLNNQTEVLLGLTCVWSLSSLVSSSARRGRWDRARDAARWLLLGALAGASLLIKLDVGVLPLLVNVLAAVCRRGPNLWRAPLFVVAGAAAAFSGAWFATGNTLSNLPQYLDGSYQIVAGYAGAMELSVSQREGDYPLAGVVAAALGIGLWYFTIRLPRRERLGAGVIVMMTLYVAFREGFTRHDLHSLIFFGVAAIIPFGLAFLARATPSNLGGSVSRGASRSIALMSVAATTTALVLVAGPGVLQAFHPLESAQSFVFQEQAVLRPAEASAIESSARSALRRVYRIPSSMVRRLDGHTVDIVPWEQTVAWAYPDFRWDPLPVIQDYSAYTPWLDKLDASFLASSSAPQYVLAQNAGALDGRLAIFDPPATQVALACHYRQVLANEQWQLLQRVPSECGAVRHLATIVTGLGQVVRIPSAQDGDMIVVSVLQIPLSPMSRLADVLFKPPIVWVTVDGTTTYRFIGATGSDLHLAVPPAAIGYSPPFSPPIIRTVSFSVSGQGRTRGGLVIAIYSIAFRGRMA